MTEIGNKGDSYVKALRFGWLTPAYNLIVRATTRETTFKSALLEQAAVKPGQNVLDLACGTGTLAVEVARRHPGAMVTGVDGDPAILRIATRQAARAGVDVRFDEALAASLPYPDGHFQTVFSSLFFHHLVWTEKVRAAREALRVLSPGADLHIADWGKAEGILMRLAFLPVQCLDGFAQTTDNVIGRLPEAFEEAGFTGIEQTRSFATTFGTLSLYRAARPR